MNGWVEDEQMISFKSSICKENGQLITYRLADLFNARLIPLFYILSEKTSGHMHMAMDFVLTL